MVKVTCTASLAVAGGPTLSLGTTVEPTTYAFSSVTLGAKGSSTAKQTVEVLPAGGTVVLLGVAARGADGKPAEVSLTPRNGATDGTTLTVTGSLLVTNGGVLAALVDKGPRAFVLENGGTAEVSVEVLTGHDD